jgi:hypothetical protein
VLLPETTYLDSLADHAEHELAGGPVVPRLDDEEVLGLADAGEVPTCHVELLVLLDDLRRDLRASPAHFRRHAGTYFVFNLEAHEKSGRPARSLRRRE